MASEVVPGYQFASDNAAGACPEAGYTDIRLPLPLPRKLRNGILLSLAGAALIALLRGRLRRTK